MSYDAWKTRSPDDEAAMNNPYDGPTEAEERAMDYEHAIERLHNEYEIDAIASAPHDGSEIAIYLTDNQACRIDRRVVFFARDRWWDTNGGDAVRYWESWTDDEIEGWLPLSRGRIYGDRPRPPPPPPVLGPFDDEVPF